jgi:hypothetical protein
MPWKPGESGNPTTQFKKGHAPISPGRPIGIVRLVRELTGNGEACVRLMVNVMNGTVPRLKLWDRKTKRKKAAVERAQAQAKNAKHVPQRSYRYVTVRDQMNAAKWLIDRGFGKVPLTYELAQRPPAPVPLEELDDKEVATLMNLLKMARQRRQARIIEGKAEILPEETK